MVVQVNVCCATLSSFDFRLGVANGKIRDPPKRRDPCLKIRDRDLKVLKNSEPETLYKENLARDFILRRSVRMFALLNSIAWLLIVELFERFVRRRFLLLH